MGSVTVKTNGLSPIIPPAQTTVEHSIGNGEVDSSILVNRRWTVLTNREHIIALEPLDKGLIGTLLRYPYEVRSEDEYFDEIQDVKVTKDMLDLARHIVNQKAGRFEPDKFEDQYETALVDLINQKRSGKPIVPKERPRGENVVDLMEALRKSVGGAAAETKAPKKPAKKPRKAAAGQKEMLMPIQGKKPAKEAAVKKPAKTQRKSA
jgi:DNA end-binding protein Ku